jgi:hypothetical protein
MIPWTTLLSACRPDEGPASPPASTTTVRFAREDHHFHGDDIDPEAIPFTLVIADQDLDGDPDVFLHRHLLAPVELFLNTGAGTFHQLNPLGGDRTGIWDNPDVPSFYAARVEPTGPGVWLWHDRDRAGSWRLVLAVDEPRTVSLDLSSNTVFENQDGLAPEEREVLSARDWRLTVPVEGRRELRIETDLIGTELRVTPLGPDPLPVFVGPDAVRFDGGVALWKPDPHGVAWADGDGSPEPDLFVSRGAIIGSLAPPLPPKLDRLYTWVGGEVPLPESHAHPSYDRGRQVLWLDVDADGTDELVVANTTTPDHVLDPDEGFRDRAPELGLDLVGPDVLAWVDLDRDGRLDQVHADGVELGVARWAGDRYRVEPGRRWGLTWRTRPRTDSIFDQASFRLVDHDRDGDLDVLLLDVASRRAWLFRNDPGGLVDVTDAVGLGEADSFAEVLVFDADDDGWPDLLAAHERPVLWRNEGGTFAPVELPAAGAVAAVADVDLDGRQDVVFTTTTDRSVLRNLTLPDHPEVRVTPDAPRGAVVLARYASGDVQAQSWGQATVTRYSQGELPLWFGSPPEDPVEALSAQCPGCAEPGPEVSPGAPLSCVPCP